MPLDGPVSGQLLAVVASATIFAVMPALGLAGDHRDSPGLPRRAGHDRPAVRRLAPPRGGDPACTVAQMRTASLNHLVSAHQQQLRNREAERLLAPGGP